MLILAAIFAILIYGMIAAMLGTILPELSERFHLTPSQNGAIASAQALGLVLASVAVGPLLDIEGKKIGLVLGLALISIALFALPRSRGFRSIMLLLFLLGVGGGILVTGANALVSDVSESHRATALNLVNLFFGLGAPLLHHRVTHCRNLGDSSLHQNAWPDGHGALRPCGCRSGARTSVAVSDRTLSLSLHHLRGRDLE